jgi:hypothetical protein
VGEGEGIKNREKGQGDGEPNFGERIRAVKKRSSDWTCLI